MATRISGVTITWGGVALAEPTEVEFSMERGLPLARSTNWTLELGQVRILAFENNALPTSEYGRRKVLKCTLKNESNQDVTIFESDCIYEGLNVRGVTNDVWRFAMTFRVMDTLNAPTNP